MLNDGALNIESNNESKYKPPSNQPAKLCLKEMKPMYPIDTTLCLKELTTVYHINSIHMLIGKRSTGKTFVIKNEIYGQNMGQYDDVFILNPQELLNNNYKHISDNIYTDINLFKTVINAIKTTTNDKNVLIVITNWRTDKKTINWKSD